jgi:hypothetical protein
MADIISFAPRKQYPPTDPDLVAVLKLCSRLTDGDVLDLYNDFIGARINTIMTHAGRKTRLPVEIPRPRGLR